MGYGYGRAPGIRPKCEGAREHLQRLHLEPDSPYLKIEKARWAELEARFCAQAEAEDRTIRSAGAPQPQKSKLPLILALLVVGGILFLAGPVGSITQRSLS